MDIYNGLKIPRWPPQQNKDISTFWKLFHWINCIT